jgi:hypothetical protein
VYAGIRAAAKTPLPKVSRNQLVVPKESMISKVAKVGNIFGACFPSLPLQMGKAVNLYRPTKGRPAKGKN